MNGDPFRYERWDIGVTSPDIQFINKTRRQRPTIICYNTICPAGVRYPAAFFMGETFFSFWGTFSGPREKVDRSFWPCFIHKPGRHFSHNTRHDTEAHENRTRNRRRLIAVFRCFDHFHRHKSIPRCLPSPSQKIQRLFVHVPALPHDLRRIGPGKNTWGGSSAKTSLGWRKISTNPSLESFGRPPYKQAIGFLRGRNPPRLPTKKPFVHHKLNHSVPSTKW